VRIRRRAARALVITSLIGGGLVAGSQPALADYHLMKIREVFAGSATHPNAQFVELQMYAAGQNFVGGKQVRIFNAAGTQVGAFTFPSSVPNGANQASILVGTPDVQAAFGVAPDLSMSPVISGAGGKACFFDPGDAYSPGLGNIDCVSWGNYMAPATGTGTPASAIPAGMSLERKISGGTSPTALDSSDDSDNSQADFQIAPPSPQRNGVAAGGADATAPVSDIGRPAHGKSYAASKIRRFRGTATDAGSGLALVEYALRQRLENGCKWWTGNRFVRGSCTKKRFKAATGLGAWTYALSKKLAPSDEGNVRFYTLFTRATDAAGNVESTFKKGRNANRFEVT
jgi:hypothetical protein